MTGSSIRRLLDEHIWLGLADALTRLGYDVVHVTTVGLHGTDDEVLLTIAANENRAILTNNVQHFAPLVAKWYATGQDHAGVILSTYLPPSGLFKQVKRLLETLSAEDLRNTCRWLHEFTVLGSDK